MGADAGDVANDDGEIGGLPNEPKPLPPRPGLPMPGLRPAPAAEENGTGATPGNPGLHGYRGVPDVPGGRSVDGWSGFAPGGVDVALSGLVPGGRSVDGWSGFAPGGVDVALSGLVDGGVSVDGWSGVFVLLASLPLWLSRGIALNFSFARFNAWMISPSACAAALSAQPRCVARISAAPARSPRFFAA